MGCMAWTGCREVKAEERGSCKEGVGVRAKEGKGKREGGGGGLEG